MRNMIFGFGTAVLVAGILAFSATPASAATKNSWSHTDTDQYLADGVTPNPDFGQLVPVWASGGGHDKHQLAGFDTLLGTTESREACVVLFGGGV